MNATALSSDPASNSWIQEYGALQEKVKRLEQDKVRLSAQLNQMLQKHTDIAAERAKLEKINQDSTKHLTELNVKYLEIAKANSQLTEENDQMKKEIASM